MTRTTSTEVSAISTWHMRIIDATAKSFGCTTTTRRVSRIIGGRATAKTDLIVRFVGSSEAREAKAANLVERLFGELNMRSTDYMRTLTDASPAQRKLARRRWLEHEAQTIASKLEAGD